MTNLKRLSATAMRNGGYADHQRNYFHVEVPPDVTLDDIMAPGFWAFHADKIPERSLIDVLSADLTLDVQVRVTKVDKVARLVFVRCLRSFVDDEARQAEPDAEQEPEPDLGIPEGYKVYFVPGNKTWNGKTIDPPAVIAKSQRTKNDAIRACMGHAELAGGQKAA